MNTEKFKSNERQLVLANAKRYTAPDIEIIDIELTQNILLNGSGNVNDFCRNSYVVCGSRLH
jgi:hypothetical protein